MKRISLLLLLAAIATLGAAAQLFGNEAPATWTATARMTSPTEGEVALTAKIKPGWHIYALTAPEEAPVATHVKFALTGVKLKGTIAAAPQPTVKMDKAFGVEIGYWEGTVQLRQAFTVTDRAHASIRAIITYNACSGFNCAPPATETLTIALPKD